jgi:1,4-alpha-glucan branching enzyme
MFAMTDLSAQVDLPICQVEKNQIIFNLQRDWDAQKIAEVSKQFSIDSLLIAQALGTERKSVIVFNDEKWNATYPSDNVVTISKSLSQSTGSWDYRKEIYKVAQEEEKPWREGPGYPNKAEIDFGVNQLKDEVIIQYKDGRTKFVLNGYKRATNVYLSGSFNDWSTTQTPLIRTETGWRAIIELEPGPYYYKYIVDGEWMADPDNKKRVPDGWSGYNSVMYRYNHQFELDGYKDAKEVALAGSFSNWSEKGLQMGRVSDGWAIPVYLKNGTYAYKFIVDNEWITDPANPVVRPDGAGNYNSFFALGDTTYFRLYGFQDAKQVWLTGNFNGWNPSELLMHRTASGWELPYVLSEGNYEYKFVVDGEWIVDPSNPYKIFHGEYENSFLSIGENHTFTLAKYPNASEVLVTGSFTGWSEENNKMIRKDGEWIFPMQLNPGKYVYKFIVDGKWIVDPANPLYEANEYGNENSVLWIESNKLP